MARYEHWAHTSGEKYLVRLDDASAITGICGPLRQEEIPEANRHNFDYEDQPLRADWIRAHRSEFSAVG